MQHLDFLFASFFLLLLLENELHLKQHIKRPKREQQQQ